MPFTIGGDWVPSEPEKPSPAAASTKPVKVRKEKRRGTWVTVVLNLNPEKHDLKALAAGLKRKLGCGGTVKQGVIEIQGDKEELARAWLLQEGVKAQ